MADYKVGIDFLLEGDDSDDEELQKPKQNKENIQKEENKEPKKPGLTGHAALKALYAEEEKERQQRSDHHHKKVKVKLKIGVVVDIYSASKQSWLEGIIKEIKGDTMCIIYGKKMKWLKINSKNWRPKQNMINHAKISENDKNEEPPPAFSPNFLQIKAKSAPDPDAYNPNTPNSQYMNVSQNVPDAIYEHKPLIPSPLPPNASPLPSYPNGSPYPSPYPDASPRPPPSPLGMAPRPPPSPLSMAPRGASQSVSHYRPPPTQLVNRAASKSVQDNNYYVYDVTFTTKELGLALNSYKDGKNCVVTQTRTVFATKKVDPGSMVCAVNGINMVGLPYETIRDTMKQSLYSLPAKITFRSKINGSGYKPVNNINQRGVLKIKVVAGMELKHAATYVGIQVGNAHLTTKNLGKSDNHPEWNEVLNFKNFRCDRGKFAVVTVWDKSHILKDKKCGKCTYSLPVKFNYLQKDTLELKNDKGKLCGVLFLNTIVSP